MKNAIKEIVRTVIPFIFGILVAIAAIYAVWNWTDILGGTTGEEDALVAKGTWEEMTTEWSTETAVPETKYIAVFVVDDVTYICGYNYEDDFKLDWFGFGKTFKAYHPEYCVRYGESGLTATFSFFLPLFLFF